MRAVRLIIIILATFLCSTREVYSVQTNSVYTLQPSTVLYIYGGKDGDEYLGKLNANRYDSESIWNEYGKYGSKYNSKSI